ncbi:MAG: SOS response-associated peptidase [Armatimonadetes bacterium]|nr:SOS response-associated peptidase [Armatimonadota bacterium]
MCGRYTLTEVSPEALRKIFLLQHVPELRPRYNIAPSQDIAVIREGRDTGARNVEMLHWGLIPSWAKEEKIGNRMINLRAETVAQKPGFKGAFRYRRCLIPADGFYEWALPDSSPRKQPVYIRRIDAQPFAFGGLWDRWVSPDGADIESCTIITTQPNNLISPLHDRMPVIIGPQNYAEWLSPENHDTQTLLRLLAPSPSEELEAYPVSPIVNNPRNEDPACIAPLAQPSGQ